MRESPTSRSMQEMVIACFFEATAMSWLVEGMSLDSATFHGMGVEQAAIVRFLQAAAILCFSEVMAKRNLAEVILMVNAFFQIYLRGCAIPMLLQGDFMRCFFGVMAVL